MQLRQKVANMAVFMSRTMFDRFTSYNLEDMNESKWLRRFLFLETIAGRLGRRLHSWQQTMPCSCWVRVNWNA